MARAAEEADREAPIANEIIVADQVFYVTDRRPPLEPQHCRTQLSNRGGIAPRLTLP